MVESIEQRIAKLEAERESLNEAYAALKVAHKLLLHLYVGTLRNNPHADEITHNAGADILTLRLPSASAAASDTQTADIALRGRRICKDFINHVRNELGLKSQIS